jgi:hypothetical protein
MKLLTLPVGICAYWCKFVFIGYVVALLVCLFNFERTSSVLKLLLGGSSNFLLVNNEPPPLRPVRIFCFILTTKKNLKTRAEPVYDAWAKECDGLKFIAVINEIKHNNNSNGSVEMNRTEAMYNNKLPLLQPIGLYTEVYQKLTTKVFSAIVDIYRNYLEEYDYFLKADDDTFIFMEHLRRFLAERNATKTYYGFNLKSWVSGGAGYVLTRECLRALAKTLINKPHMCIKTGVEGEVLFVYSLTLDFH